MVKGKLNIYIVKIEDLIVYGKTLERSPLGALHTRGVIINPSLVR